MEKLFIHAIIASKSSTIFHRYFPPEKGIDMPTPSLFDIMGPVMIGPSSSHTAGAARLGKMAYKLAGGDIREAKMYLHGSFAATYRGHGTDKALLAGLLNLNPSDERLRQSFELADQKGIRYEFIPTDLGEDVHPNTVKFVIATGSGETHEITGSSIGGGQVVVSQIDGMEVNFTGERPILVTHHQDAPGVISNITFILYEMGINIGNMRVSRSRDDRTAHMYIEMDSLSDRDLTAAIRQISGILWVKLLLPIDETSAGDASGKDFI